MRRLTHMPPQEGVSYIIVPLDVSHLHLHGEDLDRQQTAQPKALSL